MGHFFFGEILSTFWWLGTTLIVLGVALISADEEGCQKED